MFSIVDCGQRDGSWTCKDETILCLLLGELERNKNAALCQYVGIILLYKLLWLGSLHFFYLTANMQT